MSESANTIQPSDMADMDDEGYDFAQALDDQLCAPCILCNCQGCGVCIPYGIWTPADQNCACESSEA